MIKLVNILNIKPEIIENILHQYELGEIQHPLQKLDSGFESDNQLITTDIGQFVIKAFNHKEKPRISNSMLIGEYLFQKGIKVPNSLRNKTKDLITEFNDIIFAIQSYIPGKPFIDENEDPTQLDQYLEFYGKETGKFHQATYDMVNTLGITIFLKSGSSINWLKDLAKKYMLDDDYVKNQYKIWETQFDSSSADSLTTAVIHGDLGPKDFFFQNKLYTGMIDLNAAEFNFLLFDVACQIMYCGLLWGKQQDKITRFLESYLSQSPVQLEELKHLHLILRTRWLLQILYHQYRYKKGIIQGIASGDASLNLQGVHDGINMLKETNKLPPDYYYQIMKKK